MSVAIEEYNIGVFCRQNFASLAALAGRIHDDRNENGKVFHPYDPDRIFEVHYEILRCLPFSRGIVNINSMSLTNDMNY